jgi:hypothetical protein
MTEIENLGSLLREALIGVVEWNRKRQIQTFGFSSGNSNTQIGMWNLFSFCSEKTSSQNEVPKRTIDVQLC